MSSRHYVHAHLGVSDALNGFGEPFPLPTGGARAIQLGSNGMITFSLTAASPTELREFALRLIDAADEWTDSLTEAS